MSCRPGEVSSVTDRMGRRRFVNTGSPGRGNSLRIATLVCSALAYSPGSATAKANRSPTWLPSTSATRTVWPSWTTTARPSPAGTRTGSITHLPARHPRSDWQAEEPGRVLTQDGVLLRLGKHRQRQQEFRGMRRLIPRVVRPEHDALRPDVTDQCSQLLHGGRVGGAHPFDDLAQVEGDVGERPGDGEGV